MKKSSDFANRLKILIDESGLTYEEFGKKVGVSGPTLNRYVLGQRIPKVDIANKIAESIGINPLWLHGFDVPIIFDSCGTKMGQIITSALLDSYCTMDNAISLWYYLGNFNGRDMYVTYKWLSAPRRSKVAQQSGG